MITVLENDKLDTLEAQMINMPQVECPVVHHHIPGFYIRETHIPAGSFIISKIHLQRHNYSISKGRVTVRDEKGEIKELKAGDYGITEPGTRRALYVHEDIVWSTAHPVFTDNLDEIEAILIDNRDNPLLTAEQQDILNSIKQFHAQKPQEAIEL